MKRTDIIWIVDAYLDSRGVGETMYEALVRKGYTAHKVARLPNGQYDFDPNQFNQVEDSVVLYGSHQFTKAIQREYALYPGDLGVVQETSISSIITKYPSEWLLNGDGFFLPWVNFKSRQADMQRIFGGKRVFVRPNSGFKTFTGTTISFDNWDFDCQLIDDTSGVMDETFIYVASDKIIKGEFRFVIAGGKVHAGSEYRWDNILDIRSDYPEECHALAVKVAEMEYQPDLAYVCDVALTDDGPKIIELNSFSCAGLYACNLDDVIDGVNQAIVDMHYDALQQL